MYLVDPNVAFLETKYRVLNSGGFPEGTPWTVYNYVTQFVISRWKMAELQMHMFSVIVGFSARHRKALSKNTYVSE